MYADVCVFVQDPETGEYLRHPETGILLHVRMAEQCPHFDMKDEQGDIKPPGWTVTQG
jgi:hypothetical protein